MGSCCYLGSLEYSHLGVCSKESNRRRENCQGRCPVTSVYSDKYGHIKFLNSDDSSLLVELAFPELSKGINTSFA